MYPACGCDNVGYYYYNNVTFAVYSGCSPFTRRGKGDIYYYYYIYIASSNVLIPFSCLYRAIVRAHFAFSLEIATCISAYSNILYRETVRTASIRYSTWPLGLIGDSIFFTCVLIDERGYNASSNNDASAMRLVAIRTYVNTHIRLFY